MSSMLPFTPRQMQTLSAICDTLIPSLDVAPDPNGLFSRRASDLHIAPLLADTVVQVTDAHSIQLMQLALDLLDQPLVNAATSGIGRAFIDMSLEEQTL